jgi:putative inorganic carbon (hco3(-)) transporter
LGAAGLLGIFIAIQSSIELTLAVFFVLILLALSIVHPLTAALVMLILAPMRTLIETEAAVRLPLDIGQLTILLLAFAWLIYTTLHNRPLFNFIWTPLYIPLGAFLAVTALTVFQAPSVSTWLNEWLKWVIVVVLIALILMLKDWEWWVFGLVLAGVANAVVGIYIFFGGSGALHLLVENRFFRAFGTFGQPNPFGGFMGLIAPLAGAVALSYLSTLWQEFQSKKLLLPSILSALFFSSGFGLLSAGVIISWSRGAWLAFGIAMFVVVISLPRKVWQSLTLLTFILLTVGLLWMSGRLPNAIVERINSATAEIFAFDEVRGVDINPSNYAVVERLAHWQAALNMGRSHFYTGVGFGNYEVAYEQYRLVNWEEPLGHAHNYYLNVFAETGIIGFVAYLALWLWLFAITWRTKSHPDHRARFTAVGLLGTWTYLSVHSLTDNLYVNNLFLHIGVMLGIIALLYYQMCRGIKLDSYNHHSYS